MSAEAVVAGGRGRVVIGSRVTLRENGRVHRVEVTDRGQPSHQRVDPESRLGVALLGRNEGELVSVEVGFGWPDRVVIVEAVD